MNNYYIEQANSFMPKENDKENDKDDDDNIDVVDDDVDDDEVDDSEKNNTDKDVSSHIGTNTISSLSIFENLDEAKKIINTKAVAIAKQMLNNGKFYATSPEEFRTSVMKSNHIKMLTDYSTNDLSKMKLYKLPNVDIGYALKDFEDPNGNVHKNGEVVSVHNNCPVIGGIGEELMQSAMAHGAMALDHFDISPLSEIYPRMGFKEYQRFPYDSQYDPDGSFKDQYGAVDVVYRIKN